MIRRHDQKKVAAPAAGPVDDPTDSLAGTDGVDKK